MQLLKHLPSYGINKVILKQLLPFVPFYPTVRHRCIDQLRKQRVAMEYADSIQQSPEQDQETANEQIIRAEVLAHIYNAVELLPDQCRSIFKLNFIEGLKNDEIAEALGLSIQTVKNQKVKALQLLRLKLQGKEYLLLIAIISAASSGN